MIYIPNRATFYGGFEVGTEFLAETLISFSETMFEFQEIKI